ncbi:hypothetical protein [Corynebacterium kefirresidentii]|uniref:hypothetical protein n=1 Tax=Corynebacterium kefirresidentii TaxID=1979527 RepID=UPI0037364B7E
MPIWGNQLPEANAETREGAGAAASMASAYIEAGFTREEAIHIVTTVLVAQINKEQ